MGNGTVQVPPDSTGAKIDCASISVGGVVAMRQRVVIGDPTGSAGFASIVSGRLLVESKVSGSVLAAVTGNVGLVAGTVLDSISKTVTVTGAVSLLAGAANIGTVNNISAPIVLGAGAANIGFINGISATVNVAGTFTIGTIDKISATVTVTGAVSLLAGAANIGFINGISATVLVAGSLTIGGQTGNASATVGSTFTLIGGMDGSLGRVALTDASGHFVITGTVALAAGAANIGTVNNISAPVVLAAGSANIGTINNISATVNVAGTFTIGTIDKISATVTVTGAVSLLAGAAVIGTVNNISATVNAVVAGQIAAGASITAGNVPIYVGGIDGGGLARGFLTDTGGRLIISGNVVLAAGAANFGTVNNISAPVVLGAGAANIGTINNISAAVTITGNVGLIAGATLDGISKSINCVVAGQIAAGASITAGNVPVYVGGLDGGGLARGFLTDTGGRQIISGNVVLAAGTANFGTLNNISATVLCAVTGAVTVSGTIDKISAAVALAAGAANIGTINNISAAVVITAGANNIGTINNISAAVVLAAGAANIGSINNISAAVRTYQGPLAIASASHGPKVVTLSTSAYTTLIAAPGAALSIYVDSIVVTNGSSTLTLFSGIEASVTGTVTMSGYLAANGGGYTRIYDPPYKVSANVALNARVKPNVSQVIVDINFHVEA